MSAYGSDESRLVLEASSAAADPAIALLVSLELDMLLSTQWGGSAKGARADVSPRVDSYRADIEGKASHPGYRQLHDVDASCKPGSNAAGMEVDVKVIWRKSKASRFILRKSADSSCSMLIFLNHEEPAGAELTSFLHFVRKQVNMKVLGRQGKWGWKKAGR